MNPDVNFHATGIQTIVKSGEKTKVYTESLNPTRTLKKDKSTQP